MNKIVGKLYKKRRSFKDKKSLTPVFAAIDLGTTNCRLLVATPTPTGFAMVQNVEVIDVANRFYF